MVKHLKRCIYHFSNYRIWKKLLFSFIVKEIKVLKTLQRNLRMVKGNKKFMCVTLKTHKIISISQQSTISPTTTHIETCFRRLSTRNIYVLYNHYYFIVDLNSRSCFKPISFSIFTSELLYNKHTRQTTHIIGLVSTK